MYFSIKLCRLCTNHNDESLTLTNFDSDNITYLHKLNTILPGIVNSDSTLPNKICTSCITKLNETYKFIKNCLKSQEVLKRLQSKEVMDTVDKHNTEENEQINYENEVCFVNIPVKNEDMEFFDENIKEFSSENDATAEMNENLELHHQTDPINFNNEIIADSESSSSLKKSYVCEVCGEILVNKLELKLHMRKHRNGERFQCDMCEKDYNQKEKLLTHIRAHHTNEKPFKCDLCDKAFHGKENLRSHRSTHTNIQSYKCKVCDKTYTFQTNLKRHERTHFNKKSYKCKICTKAFNYSSDLSRHFRLHRNERPFKCTICAKAFFQSTDLKRHVYTHAAEKPFQCEICDRTFAQNVALKKHSLSHTKTIPV